MAVCLSVIVRAGCGHVSWFILGPVPLLLGKTWIWPEVSNDSFVTICGRLYLRTLCGDCGSEMGSVLGSAFLPTSCGPLRTSREEGAAGFTKQSRSRAGEAPVTPSICTGAAGGQSFSSRRCLQPGCAGSPPPGHRMLRRFPASARFPTPAARGSCSAPCSAPCPALGERAPREPVIPISKRLILI